MNRKESAALVILLIVLVLIIAASAVWYYKTRQSAPPQSSSVQISPATTVTATPQNPTSTQAADATVTTLGTASQQHIETSDQNAAIEFGGALAVTPSSGTAPLTVTFSGTICIPQMEAWSMTRPLLISVTPRAKRRRRMT